MKDADQITAAALSRDEVLAQLERILGSEQFCQAASLQRFLRYVVEQSMEGDAQSLKEYTIGVEVFQRGETFEPGADAVVRVQASKLRKKLASYYADGGAADPVLIELPKGHYVPCFTRRDRLALRPALLLDLGAGAAPEPAALRRSFGLPGRAWAGLMVIFLAGLLGALALRQPENRIRSGELDPALLPLWEHFLRPDALNLLAYGTPQFFSANGIYYRDVRVNSTAEMAASAELMGAQRSAGQPLSPSEVYTGVGEAQGIFLLSHFFFERARDVRVARSRLVRWEEIKDRNVIFLSSMRFRTLADELGYPSDFAISAGVAGDIRNLRPLPGEAAEYKRDDRDDYALITLWPGKVPGRRVMHLSGASTWATVAAAEYATDLGHLRRLSQQLSRCNERHGRQAHPPYFQVLLRAEVKDNQPVSINYVTHHDLEVPAQEPQISNLRSEVREAKPGAP